MSKRQDERAKELRERLNNELQRMSLDMCVKCTICETSCPVAPVTPLFSGPKFVGPQAERFRDGESVDHSVDYCSSCGTCSVVCPQGVHVAELNSLARAVMKAEQGVPVRDQLITQTVLMGKAMTPVAPIANAVLDNKLARIAMEKIVGVHRDAPMPTARTQSLHSWLKKRPARTKPATRGSVVYFHGCAGGYFEVDAAKKAIEVLEHIGYDVIVPEQGCCGLAEQSNGLFEKASASVRKLDEQLRSAGTDLPIVSTAGSCTGMLKHEAHEILGIHDPELLDVGTRIREISEFLMELYEADELPTDFRPINMRLPYHAPCQVKSQGMGTPAYDLLRLIPGLEVIDSNVTCCGIAGTYGLKKEKYEIAQAVGKPLFDMIKDTNEGLAACDTETCRWQIEKSSGVTTVHPIVLIHQAYGLGDGE
ncbi:glycerol-3-phosphate dehydrogenase subunit C [Tessaracoccus bendigoensis DSM 12906]|uniref:Glycerol-3-phosphate dehydrogenase subunit C n=1 Tax=Tessaracoccus bendigoensis DSM 12906 TaxID=1123357 RepID=A0A1M6DKF4_9ACTN|nr:anaerobic glycerol-3-phosphate dehydrogenase subunit C [Tessaracoccus bendigoensis]SHI73736.1 glycerol-3-phosphate dehydrogenase subunit C [Tessaracoccus bendigoensis DSM 12906]